MIAQFRKREIQEASRQFRKKCRIDDYGIADLFKECELAGCVVIRYPLEAGAISGMTMEMEGEQIIYTNSAERLSREIFTLAHEIGHLRLHFTHSVRTFEDSSESLSWRVENEMEEEANLFAACLLMPEAEVKEYVHLRLGEKKPAEWTALDIANMMVAFQVSYELILNRLENLSVINSGERKRLEMQKGEYRVTKLLQLTGNAGRLNERTNEKRLPLKYLQWVIHNYNHSIIPLETLEKALCYFDLSVQDISDEIKLKEDDVERLSFDQLLKERP